MSRLRSIGRGLMVAGLAIGSVLTLRPPPADAVEAPFADPPKAWILVDLDRGLVLESSQPHEPLLVASAGKLMTALLAVDRLPPDALIPVDAVAAARPPARIGMMAGQRWTRQAALQATLVISANDAAYALGAAAAGSLADFGAAAAAEGHRLGLLDSTWVDPAGLDGGDGLGFGNWVSAYDLAVLARAVLADPVLAPIVRQPTSVLVSPGGRELTLHQHNQLLDSYPGAIGIKTGHTTRAGDVLVAAATRAGRTFVVVTIGGSDEYGPATDLLDRGFASAVDAPGTGEWLPGDAPALVPPVVQSHPANVAIRSLDDLRSPVAPVMATVLLVTPGLGLVGARIRRRRRRAA